MYGTSSAVHACALCAPQPLCPHGLQCERILDGVLTTLNDNMQSKIKQTPKPRTRFSNTGTLHTHYTLHAVDTE